MPDPNVTLTAIQSHATALEGTIRRHAANAVRCKVWSVGVVVGVMVFAAGRTQITALPWVAGFVVLMALADACQVVMARTCTDAYNGFMRKLPLNGGNAMKAEECFVLPAPEPRWRQTGQVLGALGSLSVLPFYGALLALVIAFHVQMSPPAPASSSAKSAGCSAGGGCGTSGGCGSGGCGASSGKGCGCGTESAAKKPQSATAKPAPAPVTSSLRMNVVPNSGNPGASVRPTGVPFGQSGQPGQFAQPGQPPTLSPLRPVQQQPGVRLPTVPPPRFPQNGNPPNASPANANPPNGTPLQNVPPILQNNPNLAPLGPAVPGTPPAPVPASPAPTGPPNTPNSAPAPAVPVEK